MTKSHEEKLRAIKSVEDKKNMEISVLKAEIDRLKSASSSATSVASVIAPPSPPPINLDNNLDIAEMQAKLASYQAFMAEYIVDSQNQKLAAVKEAESRVEKKFMDKIEKLLLDESSSVNGIAAPSSPAVVATTAATVGEQSLFQKRNIQITQAASVNKSRWGSMEIERANEQLLVQPLPSTEATATATATTVASTATLFDRRNAQVIASAAAGKSRWGGMEVERAMKNGVVVAVGGSGASGSSSSSAERTTNAVISLEERVNLGARLLGV